MYVQVVTAVAAEGDEKGVDGDADGDVEQSKV